MSKIAVIGAGYIGRSWSILFARAGHSVALYDQAPAVAAAALEQVAASLGELHAQGLVEDPAAVCERIRDVDTLDAAVADAVHVQEAVSERLETKRAAFAAVDALADAGAVIASSSSSIPTSRFTEALEGRHRCLLAHPLNPPHLVPVVEIVPAPWTDAGVVERTRTLMSSIGQVPVAMTRELPGFIVNRLQIALLNEAFALVEDGCVTPEDLDNAITHGLGLRWSVVGPFETIDLNAARGVSHYVEIFGQAFHEAIAARGAPRPWNAETVAEVDAAMRARLPLARIPASQARRDRHLAELAKLRRRREARAGESAAQGK